MTSDKQATVTVTVYRRPTGIFETIQMNNVYPDDIDFIKKHRIKLSMETDGEDGYIVYGDYGGLTLDDEPDEVVVFSGGRNCQDTMAELCLNIKRRLEHVFG